MPAASVIIVTRNRKEQVSRAVASAQAQSGSPEVIVVDDASDDGTAKAIESTFPGARVHTSTQRKGYIVLRNLAVEMSTANIVFSIDDDAEFSDPDTVQATLKLFEDPRVGAVAIPFLNCDRHGNRTSVMPPVPDDGKLWLTNTFVGTAFAIRRDIFQQIGGFQTLLFHWGEESEYSQRLLGAGHVVAMGGRGLILHYPDGSGKYTRQVNRYISRNGLLTVWLNAPTLYVVPLLVARFGQYVMTGILHPGKFLTIMEGCWMALKTIITQWRYRAPISMRAWRLWMRLRRDRPVAMDDIAAELPSPATDRVAQTSAA